MKVGDKVLIQTPKQEWVEGVIKRIQKEWAIVEYDGYHYPRKIEQLKGVE